MTLPRARRLIALWTVLLFTLTALLMGRYTVSTAAPLEPQQPAALMELVSVSSGGGGANHNSWTSALSANGRVVAFRSQGTNLVGGDNTGDFFDIFVRDRQTGVTQRMSISSGGQAANGQSESPVISGDGQVIAYSSLANNLVGGDTNERADIFVRDRGTGLTTRVSVSSSGAQGELAGAAQPDLSDDGRYVVFESDAGNLVPNDTNGTTDIFWHDRVSRTTARLSVATNGSEGNTFSTLPAITADGQVVAFASQAFTLVSNDTNFVQDIFVRDLSSGMTTRVSVPGGGGQANGRSTNPAISADGRFVVFESVATNLVVGDTNNRSDIFRHNRQTGQTIRVSTTSSNSESNGHSGYPSISANGRLIAFESVATNLVDSDLNGSVRDIFVKHVELGLVQLVTLDLAGLGSSDGSFWAHMAPDGDWITFSSDADDLVAGDQNGRTDVFVAEVEGPPPTWTLLFYMAADGRRGWEYPTILNHLERAAINEAVEIFVYFDGSMANDTAFYAIQPDFNPTQLANYVEGVSKYSLGEGDFSDPDQLQQFIETAAGRAIAANTALILDGYGHGLSGGLCDADCAGSMSLSELQSALSAAELATGRSLDVIFAFANEMGLLEDAHLLQSEASFLVASPYQMTAWPAAYEGIATTVGYSATAGEVAVEMATAYAAVGAASNEPFAISAVDLSQIGDVVSATHALGVALKTDLATLSPPLQGAVISSVQRYGPETADLGHLATLIQATYPSHTDLMTTSQAVIDGLDTAVLYEAHGSAGGVDLSSSSGMGIFLQQRPSPYYEEGAIPFAVGGWSGGGSAGGSWGDFLVEYVALAHPGAGPHSTPPTPTVKRSPYTQRVFVSLIGR